MKLDRRNTLKALAGLALCPLCAPSGFAAETGHPHWGYEGAGGPSHWGDLDAASKVCSVGAQQSPIDVDHTIRAELSPLDIQWGRDVAAIVNNGHTIQVNVAPGSILTLDGKPYKLLQYHFHRPSEHTVGGKSFPMEVHFVHQNDAGGLAVVGVLMAEGAANSAFSHVVAGMPQHEGPPVPVSGSWPWKTATAPGMDPNAFLPKGRSYYRYTGSLTTPPCSETVEWLLMAEPVEVAAADVAAFAKLYAMNARPVQNLNRRFILRAG
ncbi:carbonate dehydratase [Rhodoplanes elegans]|uniref:Carbonic anhydrase n=1 Tax=Rhodoplanes elegans TaxID=29408 RepID=A0A327KP99_9BRAD|nr:carbonic anhydrase family protein [Rhodoplanes elegans]MBK5960096.1 carbonate dehydratase [Rhodoplanes elegans]RAI37168.1 carbonate dehydratase [Rhodoplanes elegans]